VTLARPPAALPRPGAAPYSGVGVRGDAMPGDWGSWSAEPRPTDREPVDAVARCDPAVPVDHAVVGCLGVVTIRIPGGEAPGEVRVHVRGTDELFVAYTVEALNVGNRVLVDRSRGDRAVDVTSIFTER